MADYYYYVIYHHVKTEIQETLYFSFLFIPILSGQKGKFNPPQPDSIILD